MSNVEHKNTDDLIGQLCDGLEAGKPRCPYRSISIWLILSVLYIAGVVIHSGIQVDLSEKLHNASFLFEMGMAVAILLASALASSWLCFPDSLQREWIKVIPVTLFGVFLFWILASGIQEGGDFINHFFLPSCSRGLLVEALPFVALVIMTMRGNTTQPYWTMSMNVMAVSALGWIGLRLTCGMYDSMVYGFIHYLLPFSILGVGFGFFARKIFKW
jgi:hypothetical protein